MSGPREMAELDRLVREHLPSMLRFALRLTTEPHRAEEVVQQTLYQAARAWHSFRSESSPRTWLWRILIHVHRDLQAAAACAPQSLDGEAAAQINDPRQAEPLENSIASELARKVAQQIAQLPLRQREVLVLSVYERHSAAEIVELLGITENNVYATLSVARARLKNMLAPYLDGSQT